MLTCPFCLRALLTRLWECTVHETRVPFSQKLEEQNPDFFRAYYTRLKLKDQIVLFNHLLLQQVNVVQRHAGGWMHSFMPQPSLPGAPLVRLQQNGQIRKPHGLHADQAMCGISEQPRGLQCCMPLAPDHVIFRLPVDMQ